MTDTDLKEEYRRLQEQQRRKLERVKELRQAKNQQQTGNVSFGGISDDLGLRTANSNLERSGLDETEVQDLRDRVRSLDDENARIKKLLAEKDFEVNQLRKKLTSQRQRPPTLDDSARDGGALPGGDAAVAKVMELSRKVRELTAELASEKNKSAIATRRLKEMETKLGEVTASPAPSEPANKPQLDRNEREELETELRRVRERLSDSRSQLQTTSRELKMAKKALIDETGLQEVNIHEILNGQSNWRGRQQQILTLERQVKDLKRQLSSMQQPQDIIELTPPELVTSNGATTIGREFLASTSVGSTSASTFRSATTVFSNTTSSASGRNHAALLRMQKERREKAEAELREKKELEVETKDLRKKLESVRSRNVVLSNEIKAMKNQVETLLKKGRHDDELIESMTRREKSLRELLEQNELSKVRLENSQRQTMEQVSHQKAQESQILARMREIIQDKEGTIQVKQNEIERLQTLLKGHEAGGSDDKSVLEKRSEADEDGAKDENQPLNEMDTNNDILLHKEESVDSFKKPPKSRPTSSQRPSSRASTGKSSARPSTMTPSLQRPPSRSGSIGSARSLSSARPTNADSIELEDIRTQFRAVEVERDRLRELLLVQEARYQEVLAARVNAEQQLAGLRRRSATLERQAGTSTGSSTSVAATADMTDVDRLISSDDLPVNRSTIQQLQEALAMCHEEVDTRKQALKSALEAKQQDVKWLMEIMEKTRQVYLSGIQRVKEQKG